MVEAATILARLDAIMAELAELRAEVAASLPAPDADEKGAHMHPLGDADLAPEHLIEISTAVERAASQGAQRTEEAIVVATGAPRERGCPPWVVLGVKAIEAPGVRRRVRSR